MRMKKIKSFLGMAVAVSMMLPSAQPTLKVYANGEQAVTENIINYSTMAVGVLEDGYAHYKTGVSDKTLAKATSRTEDTVEVTKDGDRQIMQYTINKASATADEMIAMTIELEEPIDTDGGTFVIEAKMKLPNTGINMARGVLSMVGTKDNSSYINIFGLSNHWYDPGYAFAMNADNRDDALWSMKRTEADGTVGNMNTTSEYNHIGSTDTAYQYAVTNAKATNNYLDYRWVVNADNNTFRFYYSEDDGANWIQPYENVYMLNTSMAGNPKERFDEPGIFPTGDMPDTITDLMIRTRFPAGKEGTVSYKIAKIKVLKYEMSIGDTLKNGIFVSPDGQDTGSGDIYEPLKTVEAAVERFWACKNIEGYEPTIYLEAGEYYISKSINLSAEYSGIRFQNYNDDAVSLTAGYSDGDKRLATASDLGGKLPKNLVGKIYRWDVSGYDGLTQDEMRNFVYNDAELVDGDEIQTLARWPESGYAYTGPATRESDKVHKFVTTADVENMTLDNARAKGYFSWNYRLTPAKVTAVNGNELTVELQTIIDSEYSLHANRRYYLYNIPEELDTPGEYYIDYEDKAVYYYPKNAANMDLQLTGLKGAMFNIESDCDDVCFEGLTMKNTRGTFIDGNGCDNVEITDCMFKNSGGRGVRIDDTYNSHISMCGFINIGDSAVELSGGDRPSRTPSGSSVMNCYFEKGGRISGTYSPFVQLGGIDKKVCSADRDEYGASIGINVENNYFYDHKHTAIIFEGNDFIIKNNIFDRCGTEAQDAAGGVYARYHATYRGNEITNNIFRNIVSYKLSDKNTHLFAIYADDLVPGFKVEDNVFYNCEEAFNFAGGQAHKFNGNLVYDCKRLGNYVHRGNQSAALVEGSGYLWGDINKMQNADGYDEDSWYTAYPDYDSFVADLNTFNEKYAANGNSTSGINAQYLGAVYVKNIEFNDNIFVSDNASAGNISENEGNGDLFATLKNYNSDLKYGVNYKESSNSSNYYSTDLSEIEIYGNRILKGRNISNELPDVSNAGIEVQHHNLATGRDDNGDTSRTRDLYFDGYKSESFASYSDGTKLSDTKEFEINSDKAISDGKISLAASESITLTLPAPIKGSVTLGLKMKGGVTALGNGVVSKEMDYREIKPIGDFDEISEIIITAGESAEIAAVAISCDSLEDYSQKNLSYDFEEVTKTTPAQEFSNRIYCYNVYGGAESQVVKEADGNMAFSFKTTAPFKQTKAKDDYLEFILTPVKVKNAIVDITFRAKGTASGESKLTECMKLIGHNASALSVPVEVSALTVDNIGSEYTEFKYTLDGTSDTLTVYKRVNGEWNEISKTESAQLPDYLDRLQCVINSPVNVYGSSYLFDDIEVQQKHHTFIEGELGFGSTVELKPDYIPGKTGKAMLAAFKNKDGMLKDCKILNIFAGNEILIPENDVQDMLIYSFDDFGTIKPLRRVEGYSIK